jgi:hypothetical protein
MNKEQTLQAKLDRAGVRHFSAKELLYLGASHFNPRSPAYGLNSQPPDALLGKIVPAALVADAARRRLGRATRVASCWRNAAYNRAVRGVANSTHRQFIAMDLATSKPAELYEILLELRRRGEFAGGLGLYKTFVHLDTRGTNATWRG